VKGRLGCLALVAILVAGCGSSPGPKVTRRDGSEVALRNQVQAWCGPRMLHFTVGAFPPKPPYADSYLMVSHRLSELRHSRVVEAGEDEELATAYVYDAKTGNEVASNLNGAHGTVRFRKVTCKPGGDVRVSLDTVLVSENGKGKPVHVNGDVRAHIGAGQ